ncbi:MAG: hypothetical protein HOO96_35980 [Polyangiaceae bacterium]|nr:hypothetical protein [Polyangiaceae bacterium]
MASTAAVDSYGEIVEQVWKLERYMANPVVLFGHQSRELPIGRSTFVGVRGGQLECTVRFASPEANPKAEQVWQLVKEDVLRAVSVGFMPGSVRYEKRGGEDVAVLSDNELHEISIVPIPANPEALAKMRAKGIGHTATVNGSRTTANDELLELAMESDDELDTTEPDSLDELILRDVENFQRTSGKAEPAWIANANDELTALASDERAFSNMDEVL